MDGAGAQPVDGPGNVFNTATDLPLAVLDSRKQQPSIDRDILRLDLSGAAGQTDVWIYTAGEGGCCCRDLGSTGNLLVSNHDNRIRGRYFNFQLRRNFPSGVCYVLVRSYRDRHWGLYRYSESDTPALPGFHP